MQLDSTHFPMVWMRLGALPDQPPETAFAGFDQLLARQQAFVLLSDEGMTGGDHEHTQEERRQTALWMKKHRAAIRSFIKGMVVIEPDAAKRQAGEAFARLYEKAWGYPMLIAVSRGEALETARTLLEGDQADATQTS
ncbi:hypothetical protein NE850_18575 [Paraburkholderia sp. USG1]|uniref:hypothetical protein n=1 Tax=Paraburkholderia sp. USG1 TaxID=2952268 RepID=UPI002855E90D|nr:hypothetical protein [Paraburkholderia sp. USG1]MDR8398351.1 hypothetical protein [Paraburkholderia sp. USG1]